MARQAIRNEGKYAELKFLHLVAGARRSTSAKRGDAIVYLDGEDWYVEIKYVTSNTVNQVRAVKFQPLVIFSPQLPSPWAVMPAQEVVRMVFEKERGQHTEIALESANLSLTAVPDRFRHSPDRLGLAVHAAIRSAQDYAELRREMESLLKRLRGLQAEVRTSVRDALQVGDGRH